MGRSLVRKRVLDSCVYNLIRICIPLRLWWMIKHDHYFLNEHTHTLTNSVARSLSRVVILLLNEPFGAARGKITTHSATRCAQLIPLIIRGQLIGRVMKKRLLSTYSCHGRHTASLLLAIYDRCNVTLFKLNLIYIFTYIMYCPLILSSLLFRRFSYLKQTIKGQD